MNTAQPAPHMNKISAHIVLASKSPRRQELIKGLELNYSIHTYDVDESFPSHLKAEAIALYLAEKKADAFPGTLSNHEILVTADTIVWINDQVLNKPIDENDSFSMLKQICGATHQVYTGVCIKTHSQKQLFFDKTDVTCRSMSDDELWYYIKNYHPFDKAGSYGIQDWFGYTAVERIHGCFYNVMGLPVGKLYQAIKRLETDTESFE